MRYGHRRADPGFLLQQLHQHLMPALELAPALHVKERGRAVALELVPEQHRLALADAVDRARLTGREQVGQQALRLARAVPLRMPGRMSAITRPPPWTNRRMASASLAETARLCGMMKTL